MLATIRPTDSWQRQSDVSFFAVKKIVYLKRTFAIYRLFHPIFSRLRPLLCADLILNEFKQIAFSTLIENDRMLIMNAANTCVATG